MPGMSVTKRKCLYGNLLPQPQNTAQNMIGTVLPVAITIEVNLSSFINLIMSYSTELGPTTCGVF